jgi:uncharacterized membrane protein YphA (DoxX/SURF4 family)
MNDQHPAPVLDDRQTPALVSFLARCGRAWDRFFFTPADPTTLGMIRISCGLIVVYTLIAFTLDLQAFFGKDAWVDLPTRNLKREKEAVPPIVWGWAPDEQKPQEGTPEWSIWFHVTDPTAMTIVHYGFILAAILFTIGFCTRITAAITWFAMLSYINRSQTTVFGVDTMTAITLLYLMIGPSGAALSVDRLIWRWWVTSRALRHGGGPNKPGEEVACDLPLRVVPSVGANLAIRLLQVHLCIIYMAAGLSKLQGNFWWQGSAVWGTIANYELAPMQNELYLAFLRFLSRNRFCWELFMTVSSIFTLVFEISFTFLVWPRRTRWVILWMAIALHGGIGLFMGLKTFSMMMLTMCLAFVAPETIHRLLGWLARAPGPTDRELLPANTVPIKVRASGEPVKTGLTRGKPRR